MRIISEWRKEHAGRYISSVSGWIIERSDDSRLWNIVNPVTGQVFDTANSLSEGKRNYSNIGKPLIETITPD